VYRNEEQSQYDYKTLWKISVEVQAVHQFCTSRDHTRVWNSHSEPAAEAETSCYNATIFHAGKINVLLGVKEMI
jgi:hypothetical protein